MCAYFDTPTICEESYVKDVFLLFILALDMWRVTSGEYNVRHEINAPIELYFFLDFFYSLRFTVIKYT